MASAATATTTTAQRSSRKADVPRPPSALWSSRLGMRASCAPRTGSARTTFTVPLMKATNGSGPAFGSTWTILGGGGALDLDFDSEAAGAGVGAGVAAGAVGPSAFSFSETDLLIASTSASNCCCGMSAGAAAGAWACTVALSPRISDRTRASERSAFTIPILPWDRRRRSRRRRILHYLTRHSPSLQCLCRQFLRLKGALGRALRRGHPARGRHAVPTSRSEARSPSTRC